MSIFDPIEGADYGLCLNCGAKLVTETDASAHMHTTFEESKDKGHRVRVLNPSRARRIESRVSSLIDNAIQDALEEFYRLVERYQVSTEEIAEALRWHSEFADAWQEYVEEASA